MRYDVCGNDLPRGNICLLQKHPASQLKPASKGKDVPAAAHASQACLDLSDVLPRCLSSGQACIEQGHVQWPPGI